VDFSDDIDYSEQLEKMTNYLKYNSGKKTLESSGILKQVVNTKNHINTIKNTTLDKNHFSIVKDFFNNYISTSKKIVQECESETIKEILLKKEMASQCKRYQDYLDLLHYNSEYTKLKETLQILEYIDDIKYYTQLIVYSEMYSEKDDISEQIEILSEEIVVMKMNLNTKKKYKNDLRQISDSVNAIEQDIKVYTVYKEIVSDRGLPKLIIQKTVNTLQNEANEIIYTLCNLVVQFDITESSKWDLTISKNGMTLGPEQCSGYERFIINVALKIVFDKYKFYSGIKMFFIDEGLDCVSEENFDKLDQLFDLLKSYYLSVLVISHNEELKKKVERTINISTDFVTSKIIN
jgi:DNA repair exonuclease SbcCD ATPase subunit